jgi:hypothetical protein
MSKLLDKIINDVSLDERVSDGMFSIEEDSHMEALREYLSKKGLDEEAVRSFSNRVLEGKYPERQAYNAKGILVTFPTPEYKAEAIKRGTHFEKDPTKGQSNLFSNPKTPPPTSPPKGESDKKEPAPTTPKTSLPVSQASDVPSTDSDTTAQTVQPKTTAAPQQTPVSTPDAEAPKEPTDLPLPPVKSPAEKEADKTAIKTMLKGDDYMLNEVTEFIQFNAPHIMEQIKKKLNHER